MRKVAHRGSERKYDWLKTHGQRSLGLASAHRTYYAALDRGREGRRR